MTQFVKQTLDNITLFTLNISLFQGNRKLSAADLKKALGVTIDTDATKAVMSLGVKRVFDKTELAKLSKIKRAMQTACSLVAPPFFGGYAVPNDKAKELAETLEKLKLKGEGLKASLIARYDDILEKYADENPAWKDLIRAGAFTANYVESQVKFNWDGVAISAGDSDGPMARNLSTKVGGLLGDLLMDIAKAAKLLSEKSLHDKSGVNRRAFAPLLKMADKLDGFIFMDSRVGKLAEMIRHVLLVMPKEGRIEGVNLRELVFLTSLLESPDLALKLAQKAQETSVLDAYDDFFGSLGNTKALVMAVTPPISTLDTTQIIVSTPQVMPAASTFDQLEGNQPHYAEQVAYAAPQDVNPFNF